MYLEISGRRCGKTHRLLMSAIQHSMKGDSCCITTPSIVYNWQVFLQKQFPALHWVSNYKIKNTTSGYIIYIKSLNQFLAESKHYNLTNNNCKLLLDEFDYFKIEPENYKYFLQGEDNYFTTTPMFIRSYNHIKKWRDKKIDDFLLYLVEIANATNININNNFIIDRERIYRTRSSDLFLQSNPLVNDITNNELYGEYK